MNYLEFLDGFAKFKSDGGFKPGLERVQAALDRLGNPEKKVKIIHVAGTNGKGSTCAILASILKNAGYNVGFYSSPHLQSFNERFRLNGKPISETDLESMVDKIKPVIEDISADPGLGLPSYFEVITVLAFLYYALKKVDVLILEVGLGGRLDATNVVNPVASVITSIGFDHTEYLGTTLSQIAFEKAGIIKDSIPVIVGVRDQEVFETIERQAISKRAPLYMPLSESSWEKKYEDLHHQKIKLTIGNQNYDELEIGLVGDHQIRNAIVAIKTLQVVHWHFSNVGEPAIRKGLRDVRWPGRLELVRENPPVLLDGAHNIEGIDALCEFLGQVRGQYENLHLVMSILKDKDVKPMVTRVAPLASEIIFTQNHNLRASTAGELAHLLDGEQVKIKIIPDFEAAISEGIKQAGIKDLVCITGSLYTIAEAREILLPGEDGVI